MVGLSKSESITHLKMVLASFVEQKVLQWELAIPNVPKKLLELQGCLQANQEHRIFDHHDTKESHFRQSRKTTCHMSPSKLMQRCQMLVLKELSRICPKDSLCLEHQRDGCCDVWIGQLWKHHPCFRIPHNLAHGRGKGILLLIPMQWLGLQDGHSFFFDESKYAPLTICFPVETRVFLAGPEA